MEKLGGGFVSESVAGPLVEFPFDLGEVCLAVFAEVGRLREILSNQSVGVFVSASLPGTRSVTKVDCHPGRGGDV